MPKGDRITLRQQVEDLTTELNGLHALVGVILAGVGGALVLSSKELEELGKQEPKVIAYVIEETDALLLRLVDKDGNPWTNGTTVPDDGRNENAPVA